MEIKNFFIESYGCQMNTAEANFLSSTLISKGYNQVSNPEDADLAIINTCSVRNSAENRIWGRLSFYAPIKKKRDITIIFTGCMADRLGESVKKNAPYIDYVVGTFDKFKILDIINNVSVKKSLIYDFAPIHYKEGDFSAYVPIMNGCNNFCTYCIVPYVRGREISRSPESILDEVLLLEEKNVKEITLLGQNVNSYKYEKKGHIIYFSELLEMISDKCKNIKWIRFDSPHPKDFSDSLINVIANTENIASHIHLPVQSGSNKILSLMNRKYTSQYYIELINKIKNKVNDVTFSTDIMVGFPDETEIDFNNTLNLIKEVGFIEAFMYYWNPIEGTKAFSMDNQIPEDEKKARLSELISFQLNNASKLKELRVGRKEKVLVLSNSRNDENFLLGKTQHNENVVFKKDKSDIKFGDFITVQTDMLNGNTYSGNIL